MKQMIRANLTFLLLLVTGAVFADANSSDEVAQGREMIKESRLQIVRSELQLSDDEATAFWPIYTTYRAETDAIQHRYAAMIGEYLERYDNADLSNEYADTLIDTFLGIKRELLDVQLKYLPEFRAVLPSLKVARLFQLENKITAEIDAQLALVVPLVDPS